MIFAFSDCTLDTGRLELRRSGAPVHVEPQVFDVLAALARAAGDVVSRDDLVETVWHGLAVSDATISARLSAARAAVGDDGKAQRVIRTIPRRGFCMSAVVERRPPEGGAAAGRGVTHVRSASGAAGAAAGPAPAVRLARSADGLPIAWARSGSGPPLLRAGHWLSHLEMDRTSPVWGPLLGALSAQHSLVRYDQRGTGLSGRAIGSGDLSDFVADMKAVADAAELERFSIFAASQASPVALRFAADYPERVCRLVLVGSFAAGRALREQNGGDIDEETVLGLIRKGWGRHGSAFVRAMSSLFMPDATPDQIDDFVRIQLASASPENAVALRRIIDRFDVRDRVPSVRAPVLLLHASNDVIQPLDQARLLASLLPDARLHVLLSDNHVPLPQHPSWQEMISLTHAFLAEDGQG